MERKWKWNWRYAALAAIGAAFLVTRLFLLSEVPRGINVDEAGMAYDAFCLANYGTDRYLTRFPVYLTNFGGGQSALYAYLCAVCIKIIGFCPTAFRLPAVLGGAIAVIFSYLIGKETLGEKWGLGMAALAVVCPYFLMASRWGLDCNLLMGFLTMSVYWLMTAIKREKNQFYAWGGVSFGITLYTYALSYLIIPLFLLLTFFYLLYFRKTNWKQAVSFALPLGLLAFPLILFVLVNSGLLEPFAAPFFSVQRLEDYRVGELSLSNFAANLSLPKTLLMGDGLVCDAFPQFGTLYYISVPFLVLGLAASVYRLVKNLAAHVFHLETLVIFQFLAITLAVMAAQEADISKCNAIYFPLLWFTAAGMQVFCGKILKGDLRLVGVGVLGGIYLTLFAGFCEYYYFQYPVKDYPQLLFNDDLMEAIAVAENEYTNGTERTIYVDEWSQDVLEPYIYTLLYRPVSPQEWMNSRGINNSYGRFSFHTTGSADRDGIYIMYSNQTKMDELKEAGFHCRQVGTAWIYTAEEPGS